MHTARPREPLFHGSFLGWERSLWASCVFLGRRGGAVGGIVALFLFLWASPSESATILRLSEAQMVEQSSLIVRASVLYQLSFWTKDPDVIVTQVTLRVVSELLGRSAPARVVVGHYGGTVGKHSMGLEGGPRFAVGEEVVLFLYPNPHIAGEYLLTGWTQGIWKITAPSASFPSDTAEDMRVHVVPSKEAHRMWGPKVPEDKLRTHGTTLRDFTRHVRALWALRRKNTLQRKPSKQGGGR